MSIQGTGMQEGFDPHQGAKTIRPLLRPPTVVTSSTVALPLLMSCPPYLRAGKAIAA